MGIGLKLVRARGPQARPADAAHLLRNRHRPGHGADRGPLLARLRGPARDHSAAPFRKAMPRRSPHTEAPGGWQAPALCAAPATGLAR